MPAVATLKLHHSIQRQIGIEEPTEWKAFRLYSLCDPVTGSNEVRDGQYERLAPDPFTMFPRDIRAHIFQAHKLAFNHWHYAKLGMLSLIVILPAISLSVDQEEGELGKAVLRRLYERLITSSRPGR